MMTSTKNRGGYRQINKALNICAFEDYLEAQQSILPEIVDVEQISPRVIRILGQNAGQVIPKNLQSHMSAASNDGSSSRFKEQTPTLSVRGKGD